MLNKKPQTKPFGGVTGANIQPTAQNNRPPSGGNRTYNNNDHLNRFNLNVHGTTASKVISNRTTAGGISSVGVSGQQMLDVGVYGSNPNLTS